MFIKVVLLFVLVIINAFFAASEVALISLNDKLIKRQAEEGDKKAQKLFNLLSEPSRFLATIQIGITLAGFLASAIAAESFADELVTLLLDAGVPISEGVLSSVSLVIITIILSYFTLVFGELLPKRIAMRYSSAISNFAVGPIIILSKITNPFVKFLTASTNLFIKLLGGNPSDEAQENVTEEEIRMMMDVGEEKGVIQETEKEMIDNIFDFDEKIVSEIMTHRINIIGLPVEATFEEVINIMNREKYTRVPVYKKTIDNIVGLLHVKDILQFLNNKNKTFNLEEIIRTPYFVPESKKTNELFKELQKNKVQLAVVIDEYGGTAGIVTMEDLLEEIVGNIFDEYDIEQCEVEFLDNDTYLFDGSISLDRVAEIMDSKLPDDEYDTLGGFITGQLGRIPEDGEHPEIEYENMIFKVLESREKRIVKVKGCKA